MPLVIFPVFWLILWAWGEVRIYRKGGDVKGCQNEREN